MPHLRCVERLEADDAEAERSFPFSVPAIRSLERLDLAEGVTFFVGENGSGKSTVMEAMAAAAALPTIGATEVGRDATLTTQRRLAAALRLVWNRRTRRGFFLRAEDFFGFVRRVAGMRADMHDRLREVDETFGEASPLAKTLAAGPARRSLAELTASYGIDPDASSHGETFLGLFQSRFVPGGLYLIDEPEAALSPQSQLGLLALLADMVGRESQFVIATHSPILLAFPGARIYDFDRRPPAPAAYDELEHVRLTRSFLEKPERYLRHLFPE